MMHNPKPKDISKPPPPPAPPMCQNNKGEWVEAEPMKCPTRLEIVVEVFMHDVMKPIKKLFVPQQEDLDNG